MISEIDYLSGSYISDSDQATEFPISSDEFIISEPFIDNKDCDQFFSMKLDYQTLSNRIYHDILKSLDLDSMAWELSNDYAEYNHVHDYPTVHVTPVGTGTIKLTDIVLNGSYNSIYMEDISIPIQDKPNIGQLKFQSKLGQKTIDDPDFDGWVYPDGRELDKTRFIEAFNVFGDKYKIEGDSPSTFRIPKLDHFIKANPCILTSNLQNVVEYTNGVGVHKHDIKKMEKNGPGKTELNSVLSVQVTSGNQAGEYSHGGQYKSGIIGNITTTLNFIMSNIELTQFSLLEYEKNIESYPKYNIIPVLIYIGGES